MAILKIDETQIPENYSHALYNEKEYDLAAEHTSKILDVIVNGVSNCLADVKSKDYPVAFTFKEANGDLIAAAVVEYHPSDDKSMPGNWSYIWTFDEKDIPEKSRIINISDVEMSSYFRGAGADKYGMGFKDQAALTELGKYIFKIISKWLDENAKEGEENGVMMDGVIQFRCGVEDGVIVKSIEPIGEIKTLIKDDSAIEV